MPIRILITEDSNLIVSDHNFKVLGCVKNENKLKNFDFVLPDNKRFWDKSGKYRFEVYDSWIYFCKDEKRYNDSAKNTCWHSELNLIKPYDNVNVEMCGYLVVDKEGNLMHINYEKYAGIDWEVRPKIKGIGPYSMDISSDQEIVLKNGKGEVYWNSSVLPKVNW